MPFNMGPMEMVLVMVVLLLVFGGKKLPEVGAGLGKGIREFKRSMNDIKSEIDQPAEPVNQIRQPTRAQVAPPQSTPIGTEEVVRHSDGTTIR